MGYSLDQLASAYEGSTYKSSIRKYKINRKMMKLKEEMERKKLEELFGKRYKVEFEMIVNM